MSTRIGDGEITTAAGDISPTTVMLADMCNAAYNDPATQGVVDGYQLLDHVTGTSGFEADAFQDGSQVVVAIRGTDRTDLQNWVADLSWLGLSAYQLGDYVAQAVAFLLQVKAEADSASITLTGHSLGGAIVQLLGYASGYKTITFNAPGPGAFLAQSTIPDSLATIGTVNSGAQITNYVDDRDVIHSLGTQLGATVVLDTSHVFYEPLGVTLPVLKDVNVDTYTYEEHSISTIVDALSYVPPIQTTLSGLTFRFTWDPDTSSISDLTDFKGAIIAAGQYYTDHFANNSTINLAVKWAPLGSGVSAQTQWTVATYDYRTLEQYLPNLPATDPVSGTHNYVLTTAQAKAIGLIEPSSTEIDATITFNSDLPWAFTSAELGVTGNYDLLGIAEHEISEAMGRVYGLDRALQVPITLTNITGIQTDNYTTLDLFRYTGPETLSLTQGANAYFSIDGGTTPATLDNGAEASFNTIAGLDYNDWADGGGNDAYSARVQQLDTPLTVSRTDIQAMSALGWQPASAHSLPLSFSALPIPLSSGPYGYGCGSTAINNAGMIVGKTGIDQTGYSYSGGTYSYFSLPFSIETIDVWGVNDQGKIAGQYNAFDGHSHGFIYDGNQFTYVDNPQTTAHTIAIGVDDNNDIFGNYTSIDGWHGFIEKDGNYTDIVVENATSTLLGGINDVGEAVGNYTDINGEQHGFLWQNGSLTTIDDPFGANGTVAQGINDFDQIVGYYRDASRTYHGFLYGQGTYTTIDDPSPPSGDFTLPNGINDADRIVGVYVANNFTISSGFIAAPDSLHVACFTRGTLILTPDGEVPVEALAIGDRVVTLSGAARPIRWIGRRAYDSRFIAGNKSVLPVRIIAGALSDGLPLRDLSVSPEHAIYIDGVLIPAGLLVNGTTITQAKQVDRLEYFHVELDSHDILIADGVAAESYVECDNRSMFQNVGEFCALYPADQPARGKFCARRLEASAIELDLIRETLSTQAAAIRPIKMVSDAAETARIGQVRA